MIVSRETLATMEKARDQLWELKKKAEEAAKNTSEAIRDKELTDRWCKMNRKIEAVKLLLKDQDEECGDPVDDNALA